MGGHLIILIKLMFIYSNYTPDNLKKQSLIFPLLRAHLLTTGKAGGGTA